MDVDVVAAAPLEAVEVEAPKKIEVSRDLSFACDGERDQRATRTRRSKIEERTLSTSTCIRTSPRAGLAL